ncbi:PhnD/SsuA/transferrin family substrate-binding protein [Trichococcus sp. K1Tr]|uniref:ABC transporter substrate-binding protein n=1 Tax=Trichococcus sp. K1Tr TaxID=3020847 RepID=UPI00232F6614|nr:PhnD/SsuA/transferrin family substrate-binding protein [Trichococcus sp. K1Tr]MDB6353327.1 PhnD/SsuA/transferrin family substrate-binding protein [Trichococcus sp. K1Tr]
MRQSLMIGLLFTILFLGGCNAWDKAYEEAGSGSFAVTSITGPSALGFVKAMEPNIDPQVRLGDTVYYSFEEDEEAIYAQLLEGKADMAVVSTETAAKLYREGAGYQLAAVNTGGYLYLLSADESISDVSDLGGKVITIVGEKSAADVVIQQLLLQFGIDPDNDLTLTYAASAETVMENVAASDILVLSEPWVTDFLDENTDFSIALDIQEEWEGINEDGMPLPLTCLIVKKELPVDRAEEWDLFVADYKDSIDWINSNPAETAELLDDHEVGITKDQATGVISRSNLDYWDAANAKQAVEKYLILFLEAEADGTLESLPDAAFYLSEE